MIYFIKPVENPKYVKIGYTSSNDATARLIGIQTGHPEKLEVWYTMPGDQQEETRLHHIFSEARCNGEWFTINRDVLLFLNLPIYDQVAISKSTYGDRLHDAAMGVYMRFDDSTDNMFARMITILSKSNEPIRQEGVDAITKHLNSDEKANEIFMWNSRDKASNLSVPNGAKEAS